MSHQVKASSEPPAPSRLRLRARWGSDARRLGWAVGLAILLHIALGSMLAAVWPVPAPPERRRIRVVSLTKVNPDVRKRKRKSAEEAPRKEKKAEQMEGQVVAIPPSADDAPPEDARFLSESNTRTERETRSRHQQQDYKNAMNELTSARAEAAKPQQKRERRAPLVGKLTDARDRAESAPSSTPAFELPKLKRREQLALETAPDGRFLNQSRSEALEGNASQLRLNLPTEKDARKQARAPVQGALELTLIPQAGVLAKISGAPANDHLEDLDEGEGTFLNSREFKYASFFNRLKKGVSRQWRPLDEYRRRDPTGNIYGQRSRVTVLVVTLRADGSLARAEVQQSSGIGFLDQEAIAAFERAEPFPNPPRGLLDQSKEIRFPFGFHLEFPSDGLF